MMIEKINLLKTQTDSEKVKSICEEAIIALSSTIYNNVTSDAKFEIEKVTIENLFEELSTIENKEVNNWVENQKRLYTLKNLGVRESINSLSSNQGNEHLRDILDDYKDYLDNGVSEVLLYEQFTTALQTFSYFPQVGNAIKSIEDRVKSYKSDVDISKIIETMKTTRSSYLVPLIEDVVDNYLANKSEQTKSHLKETLIKFTYDPFVRDIVSLVSLDATELQLEYASGSCDIEKIYSPVMYIGENEAIFNVKGFFYIKKGNNINRLQEEDRTKLDKEYTLLCEVINDPNIVVNKEKITFYYQKNDKAVVSKDSVFLNESKLSYDQFSNAFKDSQWAGNAKARYYQIVELLRENFNNIAEIDFVKRVYLKENKDHAADIFKLRDNIFITTHDSKISKSTLYRNINPIQAKHLMMEHLRFDISKTFQSLLPDEERILSEINETKEAYNDYIAELEKRITEFRSNPYAKEVNEQVVEALHEELKEVKDEYKDYLHRVEAYIRPIENIDEEISITLDVHGKKYTIPIPDTAVSDIERRDKEGEEEAGTEVGSEDVEDKPAGEITFDDEETELLGDSPSIQDDEIDLGGDETEADADAEEAEAERDKKEQEKEAKDNKEEEDADEDEEDDEVEESSEGKDTSEYSEGNLEKEKFSGDKPKKRRVFLKKRKVTENLNEHHKTTKKGKIDFICKNDKKCKREDLEKMSAEAVDKKYAALEKKLGMRKNINENLMDELNKKKELLKQNTAKLQQWENKRQNSIHPFDPQKKVSDYVKQLKYYDNNIKEDIAKLEKQLGMRESFYEPPDGMPWSAGWDDIESDIKQYLLDGKKRGEIIKSGFEWYEISREDMRKLVDSIFIELARAGKVERRIGDPKL